MKNSILIILVFIPLLSCTQDPKDITIEQFREVNIDSKKNFLLDVRTVNEYNFSRIKNSINIDVLDEESFKNQIKKLDPSLNYYVICRSGNRSMKAIRKMEALGFKNLYNITGGMLEWEKQQLPVEK
ncbi:rhodanese-like domain-containing protein [Marivirga lumbricoides]|nr:rhodanese-like domain-containing protein [Marivirga lumbricoides]